MRLSAITTANAATGPDCHGDLSSVVGLETVAKILLFVWLQTRDRFEGLFEFTEQHKQDAFGHMMVQLRIGAAIDHFGFQGAKRFGRPVSRAVCVGSLILVVGGGIRVFSDMESDGV